MKDEKMTVENSVENVDNSLHLPFTGRGYVKHKTAAASGSKKGKKPDKRRFFLLHEKSKKVE